MTIHVSFPLDPIKYEDKSCTRSWCQIAYFVVKALKQNFESVECHPWDKPIKLVGNDILISCVPNRNILNWKERTIIVDNDNFDVGKWKFGKFQKYGLNKQIDHTFKYNNYITNIYGAIIKTNEIAISKWEANHPDILEKKQFLLSNIKHFRYSPHPIDKSFFSQNYNKDLKLANPRMLVYHVGPRKNAKELIDTLNSNPVFVNKFDVTNNINKTTDLMYTSKYTYFAHVSVSEGFPYLANEFLCQGIVLYGNEEWWNPYGYDILKYTYDPSRNNENISNLTTLLSSDFLEKYYLMRNDILAKHLARKDNDWGYLTDILLDMIKGLR